MTSARLRDASRLVLGNLDRLEVAAAVSRSQTGLVNASEIVGATGIERVRVRAQLERLSEAGLLDRLPRASGDQFYERRDSVFWRFALEYSAEFAGDELTDESRPR